MEKRWVVYRAFSARHMAIHVFIKRLDLLDLCDLNAWDMWKTDSWQGAMRIARRWGTYA